MQKNVCGQRKSKAMFQTRHISSKDFNTFNEKFIVQYKIRLHETSWLHNNQPYSVLQTLDCMQNDSYVYV